MWLSFGAHCTACRGGPGGGCVDPPTANEPWCPPTVDGRELCISECPNRYAGDNARKLVQLTRFAKKGLLPVAGGVLDQAQQFISAMDYVMAQEQACKAKLKIADFGNG